MFNREELEILEELLNEEILNCLRSGHSLKNEYVINCRNMLKKLNLREIYDYDKKFKNMEE